MVYKRKIVGRSSSGGDSIQYFGEGGVKLVHGVKVISADDVDLSLGSGHQGVNRLFSHSSWHGFSQLDAILSDCQLLPQPGGFSEVYLHNGADHPGHPDYLESPTRGSRESHRPLMFVFNEKIFEALPELERQEYPDFHNGGRIERTDWELKAKELPFTDNVRGQGRLLEFLVVSPEDIPEACESLARHDLGWVSVMPLQEWRRITGKYRESYDGAIKNKFGGKDKTKQILESSGGNVLGMAQRFKESPGGSTGWGLINFCRGDPFQTLLILEYAGLLDQVMNLAENFYGSQYSDLIGLYKQAKSGKEEDVSELRSKLGVHPLEHEGAADVQVKWGETGVKLSLKK